MKINKSNLLERLQTFRDIILHRNTVKSARVTYNVVWNLLLVFLVIGLMGLSFAGGAGAGYFASLVKDEPIRSYDSMKKDIYNYEETTELYFANNVYLGKLRSDLDREEIMLADISPYLIDALISTEDQYFYEHEGVVPKAIMRALLQEVTNSATQTGGSTLTQQLIKNQILTNEVSFERKAKEILLALRLEQFFKKEEILEAYLNVATFGRNSSGRNIAGVKTAAKGIFGIEVKDLNLAQAAFIAGLPQSPSRYTPFTNRGELKEDITPGLDRMKTVLSRMLENKKITKAQYDQALAFDLVGSFAKPKLSPQENYPWLTSEIEMRAKEILAFQLAEKDGYEDQDLLNNDDLFASYMSTADKNLRQNGYRIYSTIDKDIYDKMQQIKNEYAYYGSDRPEKVKDKETGETVKVMEPVQVGAVMIENQTGRIISFVGGRDHSIEQLNHATRAKRPNGSTMKPLLVYAPAMELGASHPGSILADVEIEIPAGSDIWSPKNYGEGYHGFVSARHSLAKSYNVPAAITYMKIIDQRPVSYLEKMGFSSLAKVDAHIPAMALGGMTEGVTVEENTNAYATFANGGKFVDAYLIERIETKDGELIYEHKSEEVEVFSPQTAYLTIDMMKDVIKKGTAAGVPGMLNFSSEWAGKTGTSQDYKDAWFVASNPNITFGLWLGYDTPKSLEKSYKGYSYSRRNQMLWAQLMNAAYEIRPELIETEESFNMPGGIVRRTYCTVSGLLPSDLCKEAGLIDTDIFNAEFVPKEEDDSLELGKYIMVGEKIYRALENSPEEFTKEGIMLKQSFLEANGLDKLEDLSQLIPKDDPRWNSIIIPETKDTVEDDGQMPSQVTQVVIKGNKLTWAAHPHKDIIGYRIYRASNFTELYEKVASITLNDYNKENGFTIDSSVSSYYVTAVDIAGNESPNSETVAYGDWTTEEPIEELPELPKLPELPGDEDENEDDESGNDDGSSDDPIDEIIDPIDDGGTNNTSPDPSKSVEAIRQSGVPSIKKNKPNLG
ncbi:transglycosylase domain-containing protein [Bacillus salitolerans]|uniref:Transglycosylase domain-containing protein n=1 Tax=Bacillus salitolerans TaxID=1437434 RepID=A0ABW4LWX5_9BACI